MALARWVCRWLPFGGQLGIGTESASLLQATKCIKNLARIEAGRWESLGLEVLGTGSQSLGGQKIGKWWGQSWAQGWAKFWAQRDISMGIEQKRGSGHRIGTDDGENLRKFWAQSHEE